MLTSKIVEAKNKSHLQNLNYTFVVVPWVDGLKYFTVFATAKFSN